MTTTTEHDATAWDQDAAFERFVETLNGTRRAFDEAARLITDLGAAAQSAYASFILGTWQGRNKLPKRARKDRDRRRKAYEKSDRDAYRTAQREAIGIHR
jgi:hypothetical protein